MKKREKILLPALVLCICGALLALLIIANREEEAGFSEHYVRDWELAPLLSFTYYDKEGWEEQLAGLVKGKLSYGELSGLLEFLGVREYVTYEEKAGFTQVSREVFFAVYDQLLDLLDGDGRVMEEERVFIGPEPKEGQWLTQKGYETVTGGLSYLNQYDMYRVYTLEGAMIGVRDRLDTEVAWENVFVHEAGDGKAEVLFEKEQMSIAVPELADTFDDTICDFYWKDKAVTAIYKKEDRIQGKILAYDETKIEISGYGSLSHSGSLKVYKTYGTVEQLDESKLVIGNLMAEFVVAQKQVCGIILKEPAQIEQIRVLLLNGSAPYYSELYLAAGEGAEVTFLENRQPLAANTVLRVSDYWQGQEEGYLRIDPVGEGLLYLTDEAGTPVSLGYQGSFEVRKYPEGYCVVNELSLEDYLCGVVPSEMPSSYEPEALRAQAVCARSYACIQLTKGDYAGFGANVDDSTNYQVYNKQERDERTTLAVRDTVGEVLMYQGAVAEAYYYSTSCGFTQDMSVWNQPDTEGFGYLCSTSLLTGDAQPDLAGEEGVAAFLQSRDYPAYDSEAAYFRWQAGLDTAGLLAAVNQAASERRAVKEEHVQILDGNGQVCNVDISQLGNITGIQPVERSAGGVLKRLQILYENGSILLTTEYNIRRVLGAAVTSLTDRNDNPVAVSSLLPSGAFTVQPGETGYVLYGGGYGHGIGMSQNGANGMAKAGFAYTEILQKFYHDISIENIYNGSS